MPEIDISGIFHYLIIFSIYLTFGIVAIVTAIVYFFLESKKSTKDISKKATWVLGLILTAELAVAFLARFFVEFPEIDGIDMNSNFNFIFAIISGVITFFVYCLYIRNGEHFAVEREMPGSLFLRRKLKFRNLDWKWIIIPIPFLYLWTMVLFFLIKPEVSDVVQATTPQIETIWAWIYTFLIIAVIAPLKEEIFYRHYIMGIFYKWFGTGKKAVLFNIIISSVIFSIAHFLNLENSWLKILQVIPLGVVLAWVNYKKGLEHSILLHFLFNVLALPVSMLIEAF